MTLPDSLDDLLRGGLAALRTGDRGQAMNLLSRAVRMDPRSEQAWLYLAGAVSDLEQRRTCLERVLSLNPQNSAARQGLQTLAAPAPPPPAVVTTVSLTPAAAPPVSATTLPVRPMPPATPAAAPTPAPPVVSAARSTPPPVPSVSPADPPAPPTADRVMSLLSARPPEEPALPIPLPEPEPATSTTMRLPPAFVTVDLVRPTTAQRRPADRIIWGLVLTLGLVMMLGSAVYLVILLRG